MNCEWYNRPLFGLCQLIICSTRHLTLILIWTRPKQSCNSSANKGHRRPEHVMSHGVAKHSQVPTECLMICRGTTTPYYHPGKCTFMSWLRVKMLQYFCWLVTLSMRWPLTGFLISLPSAPQALPVSTAEPAASPLHPLQSVGRPFQHHVHPSGPLQRQESPDNKISILCPEGKHSLLPSTKK